MPAPEIPFERRIAGLPKLGVGISTEFGAAPEGLDVLALRRAHPEWVQFLVRAEQVVEFRYDQVVL